MPSRLVLTLGLHGSASTWSYNVVRELLVARFGARAVAACFANALDELFAEPRAMGRLMVCKTHGFPRIDMLAHLTQAPIIVTVRDPRDAALSLIERFGSTADAAIRSVAQDCEYAAWAAAAGHLVLRYEDGFFDSPDAVRQVASHLGLDVAQDVVARIAGTWRTESVRAFAATVPDLPPERLVSQGSVFTFDRLTQIHRTHIGDGRIGKWRERFAPAAQADLARLYASFLVRFRYPET